MQSKTTSPKTRRQAKSKDTTPARPALPGDTVTLRSSDGRIYRGKLFPLECGSCVYLEVGGLNYFFSGHTIVSVLPRS
jgi:hypothetical protein